MVSIDQFLELVDAYAAATGLAESTISTKLLNDGKGIARLRDGKDIGVRKVEEKLAWLSTNWPPDAVWPSEIPRPAPQEADAAAANAAGG